MTRANRQRVGKSEWTGLGAWGDGQGQGQLELKRVDDIGPIEEERCEPRLMGGGEGPGGRLGSRYPSVWVGPGQGKTQGGSVPGGQVPGGCRRSQDMAFTLGAMQGLRGVFGKG